jgi:hemerythrin superfamily protein
MATSRKTSTTPATKSAPRKAASSRSGTTSASTDAIALLKADHKRVSDLYEQYEKTRSAARKRTIVDSICLELTVHAQVEEEIFYPAVKAALKDKELVPEAQVEHATLKELIAQVKDKEPDGELFDARIKVMSEYTKHHVKEEQNEMFPKVRKTRLDLKALGEQIAARKEELMASPELLEAPPMPASPALATETAD